MAALMGFAEAPALATEDGVLGFQLQLLSPGTRPAGLGGAAVATVDDVTAAASNPAFLSRIGPQAVYLELRSIDTDAQGSTMATGSLDVDLETGARDLPYLGVSTETDYDSFLGATFLGIAWPFDPGSRGRTLAVAASWELVASQKRLLGGADGTTQVRYALESFPNTVVDGRVQAYSIASTTTGSRDYEVGQFNGSVAYDVHPDFSVGVTLSWATLDASGNTTTEVLDPLALVEDPGHPRLESMPDRDRWQSALRGDDGDFVYTLAVDWHPDSAFAGRRSPWRFGTAFRKGASFEVTNTTKVNQMPSSSRTSPFVIPDRYTLGASYRPSDRWLVTAQYERIEYEDLLDGMKSVEVQGGASATYAIENADVPRLGVEYTLPFQGGRSVASFWAGYYRASDGAVQVESFRTSDPELGTVHLDFAGETNEVDHWTAGLGAKLGRTVIHLAGDFSDDQTQIIGGLVVSLD